MVPFFPGFSSFVSDMLHHSAVVDEFEDFLYKSGRLEFLNDLRFWLEVQRFKTLCHSQGSIHLMREKVGGELITQRVICDPVV